MENLTVEQQQKIKKMSNDRLRVKLTAAGYDEETVVAIYTYIHTLITP